MAETFQQFFGVGGGGAAFADNDSGGMIGQDGGFHRRSPGSDGQGKRGDDSIARAGYIEHFLGDGGDVKRFLAALAKQHAQFAERDQKHGGAQFVEQTFRDEHQVFI